MTIIKCKMCGGDINLSEGQSFGSCDSCGSTMTLPKVSDERKINLFNRANHFRRLNDFDKALTAYENILNEDNTDAEAHWGVVLSRYGIEYVEDPISHNRIPTCHRMQMESVLTDQDYLSALEYSADGYTRSLYEEEAAKISVIQKGILSISQKEEPYDVFICYKETTDGGSRTKDSTMAQDIYYHLKQECYKVFFSRITLEDKLGQEYEPYIFGALNSSKVMVVVGTHQEHFNAVWVKNEWSRFIELIKKDRSRLLIPCYKDMDAYDLPEELSTLQSQDMGKIGFIQDLVRGIKKVIDGSKKSIQEGPIITNAPVASASVNINIAPLIRRAFLCLEDEEWYKADELLEQVLNTDPESAEAYIGKLMVELRISHENKLQDYEMPLDKNNKYQKALRFADSRYKEEITRYNQTIIERNELRKLEEIYVYALNKKSDGTVENYREGKINFQKIIGYKDADIQAQECGRLEEESRKEEKRRNKNFITLIAIGIPALAISIVFLLIVNSIILPLIKYNKAIEYANNKQYSEAITLFNELGDYKDSKEQILIGKYSNATEYLNNKHYSEAITLFNELGDYKESKTLIKNNQMNIIKSAKVGDIVYYGSYEQDNNPENGKEYIRWRVLSLENGKALLISENNLDCKPYNRYETSVSWSTCTLRNWLNNEFLVTAFSDSEKASIITTEIVNSNNALYGTNGGNNTKDIIFLLSKDEVIKYFEHPVDMISKNTAYTKSRGAYSDNFGAGWWWLRSPGNNEVSAVAIYSNGAIYDSGSVDISTGSIRPALYINLNS